jgi:hypothetical protein
MKIGRRMLWLAALLFCACLIWAVVEFLREDRCMDAGGRWITEQARCEI